MLAVFFATRGEVRGYWTVDAYCNPTDVWFRGAMYGSSGYQLGVIFELAKQGKQAFIKQRLYLA